MKPAMDVFEAAKRLEESKFKLLTSPMFTFFQTNKEEVESLLSKVEIMNMDMLERTDNVRCALGFLEEQEQGRKIRVTSQVPVYTLDGVCECEIRIEDYFYLIIALIISPQGWRFKVYARELWNRSAERENQRAIAWYEAQAGPRTFPYNTEPSEVAAQLRRLIESAMTDPFPLPE